MHESLSNNNQLNCLQLSHTHVPTNMHCESVLLWTWCRGYWDSTYRELKYNILLGDCMCTTHWKCSPYTPKTRYIIICTGMVNLQGYYNSLSRSKARITLNLCVCSHHLIVKVPPPASSPRLRTEQGDPPARHISKQRAMWIPAIPVVTDCNHTNWKQVRTEEEMQRV